MTELKTLKDLENEAFMPDQFQPAIDPVRLRAEAIKWIKYLETFENEDAFVRGFENKNLPYSKENNYAFKILGEDFEQWAEATDIDGAIKILKLFFNITEADLK